MSSAAETIAGSPQLTVHQGGTGSGLTHPGRSTIVYDNFATGRATRSRSRIIHSHGHCRVDPDRDVRGRGRRSLERASTVRATPYSAGRRTYRELSPSTRSLPPRRSWSRSPTIGIGPGAVIASDNTLGAFSQFQGELYVAFVGRSLATAATSSPATRIPPATRTFTWSPRATAARAGRQRRQPVQVNQDNAADGRVLRGEYERPADSSRTSGGPSSCRRSPWTRPRDARGELSAIPATMRRTRGMPRT